MLFHQVFRRFVTSHAGALPLPSADGIIGTDQPAAGFHVETDDPGIAHLEIGRAAESIGYAEIGLHGPRFRPLFQQALKVFQCPASRKRFVDHLAVVPVVIVFFRQVVGSVVHDGEADFVGAAVSAFMTFVRSAEHRRISVLPARDVRHDIVRIVGIALFPDQRTAAGAGPGRYNGRRAGPRIGR